MRRIPSLLAAPPLLALVNLGFSPASGGAQPVAHLAWDDCGAAGRLTRTFACDTNVGSEQLVVSFVPPAVAAFTGIEVGIRFWPPAASLPSWWALSAGGCRATSLRSSPFAPGFSACPDPWTSEMFWTADLNTATQELRAFADLNKGQEHALEAGVEYHGLRFTFNHAKSAGAGACAGCSMPVGMYLSRLRLQLGPPDPTFEYPLTEVPYVNWQCEGTPVVSQGVVVGWSFPGCATPARTPTWGRIKTLYR